MATTPLSEIFLRKRIEAVEGEIMKWEHLAPDRRYALRAGWELRSHRARLVALKKEEQALAASRVPIRTRFQIIDGLDD